MARLGDPEARIKALLQREQAWPEAWPSATWARSPSTKGVASCHSRIFIAHGETIGVGIHEPTSGIHDQAVRVTTVSDAAFDALISTQPGVSLTTRNQAVRCRRGRRGPLGSKSD
jgi:hypothetical protein